MADVYTIKVEGIDTQGTASCQINEKSLETTLIGKNVDGFRGNILIESMECNLSKRDNLKNGDKIIIEAKYDKQEAIVQKALVKERTKEYTVSGLPEYLKSFTQLSSNNVKILDEMADKSIKQFFDKSILLYPSFNPFIDHHTTYKALKHEKCVVVTRKTNADVPFGFPYHDAYIQIPSAEVYDNGKRVATTYLVAPIQEVIISTDKNVHGNAEQPKDYDTLDEAEKAIQEDYSSYNIEKVNNT